MPFGDWLSFPNEPLESFMPSLSFKFCTNYLSAFFVVVVHPVALEEGGKRKVNVGLHQPPLSHLEGKGVYLTPSIGLLKSSAQRDSISWVCWLWRDNKSSWIQQLWKNITRALWDQAKALLSQYSVSHTGQWVAQMQVVKAIHFFHHFSSAAGIQSHIAFSSGKII